VLDAAPAGAVAAAVRAGVDWVQVRDRSLEGAALLARVDGIRAEVLRGSSDRERPARVIVNRRIDVALAAGADGVHLGFDGATAEDARALLGPEAEVGVSAHAPEEIDAEHVSYVHLAPIHPPLSKAAGRPPLGVAALVEAVGRGVPVIAQGGLDASNAREAIEAGAAGIAVTGAILQAPDPRGAARTLRQALDA
jgi:thiamine-phosphate pyrophosphorylase